jgi:Glyoxalase superfamily protein
MLAFLPAAGPYAAAQSGRQYSWEDEPVDAEVIPVLRVSDAAWYQRLGFAQEWEFRFEPGFPAFVSVARGAVRLFLSEHTGDARPDTLIWLRLRDIDAIAEEFGAAVEQMPWGRGLAP